jgi:hypothetical protein
LLNLCKDNKKDGITSAFVKKFSKNIYNFQKLALLSTIAIGEIFEISPCNTHPGPSSTNEDIPSATIFSTI